jgi:hypothetical protein
MKLLPLDAHNMFNPMPEPRADVVPLPLHQAWHHGELKPNQSCYRGRHRRLQGRRTRCRKLPPWLRSMCSSKHLNHVNESSVSSTHTQPSPFIPFYLPVMVGLCAVHASIFSRTPMTMEGMPFVAVVACPPIGSYWCFCIR